MANYRSLDGGFFSNTDDDSLPASIRFNNPGAINGNAAWVKASPGFVKTVTIGGGNPIAVMESPEQGVALWVNLLKRYRESGAFTLIEIVNRYGGGQDYSAYAQFVSKTSGLGLYKTIELDNDAVLLPFAKAMFRYESGRPIPWSDAQLVYGFELARGGTASKPITADGPWESLRKALAALLGLGAAQGQPGQKTASSESVPPWLATMRAMSGTKEYPGGADNPVIIGWRDQIAKRYPEMGAYCRGYVHDAIPWCGLTVAYCMARNGVRPVFGSSDTDRFLWADAWSRWGTRLAKPRLGCVMVFTRNGGGHVSLYEGEDGDDYLVRGGNQSDAVNVTRMPKSKFTAAVWPA